MTQSEFYEKLIQLASRPSDQPDRFINLLRNYLKEYVELLEATKNKPDLLMGIDKDRLIDKVTALASKIVETVKCVYAGQPAKAYGCIREATRNIKASTLVIDEKQTFYRMRRAIDAKEKRTMDHVEMFHIPFSKRNIVKTQRYSTPGYPCLYLGDYSFGCWEELGRPDLSMCMVSRLENQEMFHVWDFSIPDVIPPTEGDTEQCLLRYALVIASTIKTHDEDAKFKPEYIIPQLLLELLQDEDQIDGIKYTSIHWNKKIEARQDSSIQDLKFAKKYYSNYVVPVKKVDNGTEHCPDLCKLFLITNPTCEEYQRILASPVSQESQDSNNDPYEGTLFAKLDMALRDVNQFPLVQIKETRPKSVNDAMIKVKNMVKKKYQNTIRPVIKLMTENDYTHIPIVEGLNVVGVFSENTIFKITAQERKFKCTRKTKFEEIRKYIQLTSGLLDTEKNPVYMFAKPNELLSELIARFQKERETKDRIDIVLVTSTGRSDGEFLGLLTPTDFVKDK